jgi:hypothetical protein
MGCVVKFVVPVIWSRKRDLAKATLKDREPVSEKKKKTRVTQVARKWCRRGGVVHVWQQAGLNKKMVDVRPRGRRKKERKREGKKRIAEMQVARTHRTV